MRKTGTVLTVLIIVNLILLVALAILVTASFLNLMKQGVDEKEEISEYQSLHYNPTSEKTTVGIVSIPTEWTDIPKDGFEIIEDSGLNENNLRMISNFGDTEYICHGHCSCDNNDDRRMPGIVHIGKGLVSLLVASTGFAALKLATDKFDESCKKYDFEDYECPSLQISSHVDDCEEVKKKEQPKIEEDIGTPQKRDEYLCTGNCVSNTKELQGFADKNPTLFEKNSKWGPWGIMGKFTPQCHMVNILNVKTLYYPEYEWDGHIPSWREKERLAIKEFLKVHLNDEFCKKQNLQFQKKVLDVFEMSDTSIPHPCKAPDYEDEDEFANGKVRCIRQVA